MWVVVGCRVIECRGMGVLGKGMRSHETFPSHMQHPVGTPFHASMLYRGGRPSSFAQSISWLNRCKPAIGSAASPFLLFRYRFVSLCILMAAQWRAVGGGVATANGSSFLRSRSRARSCSGRYWIRRCASYVDTPACVFPIQSKRETVLIT